VVHGTKKTEKVMKCTVNNKRIAHEVRGISSEAGSKSVVGKICERSGFETGNERVREL